jgi:hypothetical protein
MGCSGREGCWRYPERRETGLDVVAVKEEVVW